MQRHIEIDKPIAIAVILFVVLILVFYLVIPKYKTFQDFLMKLGIKEAEFRAKNAYFIEITKTHKELMQYQDNLKKIETALPNKLSLASLVNFIYQKGSENGIIIQRITILKSAPIGSDTNIKETNVSLSLFGSYAAFKNFLISMVNSFFILIRNFSLIYSFCYFHGSSLYICKFFYLGIFKTY